MPLYRHAVGKQIYVFTSSATGPSRTVGVISAHGVTAMINNMGTVPRGTKLHYYAPHGFALQDVVLEEILQGKVRRVIGPQQNHDYILTKYQNSAKTTHNTCGESIAMISGLVEKYAGIREDLAKIKDSTAQQISPEAFARVQMDIITLRNRNFMLQLQLSDVLRQLHAAGFVYTDIHCSFCRSSVVDGIRSAIPGYTKVFGDVSAYVAPLERR